MFRARVRLPLLPHVALIGFVLGVGSGQWGATTVAAPMPAAVSVAPVLVSVSTLDLSRLVPSQFGDWDAPASAPER